MAIPYISATIGVGICHVFGTIFTLICAIPSVSIGALSCLVSPYICEIPKIVFCATHTLGFLACNLIDLVWLTAAPICTVSSLIGGAGAFICVGYCPCAWWIPCSTFAGTCGILGGKACYLGATIPYTCWLEPFYCIWLSLDALFYYFGILCAPVCVMCSLPLIPSTWACSGCSICVLPALGGCSICTLSASCLSLGGGALCFDACALGGIFGGGCCLFGSATPPALCLGSCPVSLAGILCVAPPCLEGVLWLQNASNLAGFFAVCPLNKLIGTLINNFAAPIITAIINVVIGAVEWIIGALNLIPFV